MGNQPSLPDAPDINEFLPVQGYMYSTDGGIDKLTDEQMLWIKRVMYNAKAKNILVDKIDVDTPWKDFILLNGSYVDTWSEDQKSGFAALYIEPLCLLQDTLSTTLRNQYAFMEGNYTVTNEKESWLGYTWGTDTQTLYLTNPFPVLKAKVSSNTKIGIPPNYYIFTQTDFDKFEAKVQWALNHGFDINKLPNTSIFNLNVEAPLSDEESKLMQAMGIAVDIISALSVVVELAFTIVGFLTLGIALAIRQLIVFANEVAMLTGAYNELFKLVGDAAPEVFGLSQLNEVTAEYAPEVKELAIIERTFDTTVETSDPIMNQDTSRMTIEEHAELVAYTENVVDDTDDQINEATVLYNDFNANAGTIEKNQIEIAITDILKAPMFYGIVSGMIAGATLTGPACLRMLKNICRTILSKIQTIVRSNIRYIRGVFTKKLNKLKLKRTKQKDKLNELKAKLKDKAAKEKRKLDEIMRKAREKLKSQIKAEMKKLRKRIAEEIRDRLKDFKMPDIELPSAAKTVTIIGLITALFTGGLEFLTHLLEKLIALIPEIKDLIEVVLKLLAYGVDTLFILGFIAPAIGIMYMTVALIYKLENRD